MPTISATRSMRDLSLEESLALLLTRSTGRLVYLTGGTPRIVPLNYLLHRRTITFRTGDDDLLATIEQRPVLLEVDYSDPARRMGWSVIVHGVAEEIRRGEELEIMRELPLRPLAPGNHDRYVRIVTSKITGRMIS